MENIDKQHEVVKKSLFEFVNTHTSNADFSVVDEIVLNYVIAILEEASEDPNFDVDGFVEMMSAYLPDFSQIETGKVYQWIVDLENKMSNEKKTAADTNEMSIKSFSLSDILPESTLRTKTNSESTDPNESTEVNTTNELNPCEFFAVESEALQEIFPDSSSLEIKHCITIANGDIDHAIQMILDRAENGESLTGSVLAGGQRNQVIDDNELKNRIISRYSYVDSNGASKEYKPVAPKIEPKKLIRYRDNKIVSLKGERYTEVRKSGEEVELRRPKKHQIPLQ